MKDCRIRYILDSWENFKLNNKLEDWKKFNIFENENEKKDLFFYIDCFKDVFEDIVEGCRRETFDSTYFLFLQFIKIVYVLKQEGDQCGTIKNINDKIPDYDKKFKGKYDNTLNLDRYFVYYKIINKDLAKSYKIEFMKKHNL